MSDVKLGLVHDFFGTVSGTHDHTDGNFGSATPKAALHMMCYATALNTRANHANFCIGASTSATAGDLFTFFNSSEHANASTFTARKAMEVQTAFIGVPADGNRDGWHDFSAFGTNKITYDVTNTYDADYGTVSLLLGGDDLDPKVGTFDVDDATVGTTKTISLGEDMTNSALIIFGVDQDFTTSTTSGSNFCNGMGLGSTSDAVTFRQASAMVAEPTSLSEGRPVAYLNSTHIFQQINASDGSPEFALEWTAADSDGFTLTVRTATASSTAKFGYIAFPLPSDWNATVSVEDSPTSDGNQSFTPAGGSGWTPQLLIQIPTLMESVNATKTDNEAGGLGMRWVIGTGSDDEYCVSYNIEDASETTDTEVGIHDKGFLNEDDGTAGLDVSLVSFDAGGWTDSFDDSMLTAKKLPTLILGPNDASGAVSASFFGANF